MWINANEAAKRLLENDDIEYVEPDVIRIMQSANLEDILGESDQYFIM